MYMDARAAPGSLLVIHTVRVKKNENFQCECFKLVLENCFTVGYVYWFIYNSNVYIY